jgi:hypothetical protein
MNKNTGNLLAITVVFLTFLLSGCRKLLDYRDTHPNGDDLPQIKAIAYGASLETPASDTFTVAYDRWGNPTLATRSIDNDEQGTKTTFLYDNQHRLTYLINTDGNDSAEFNGQIAFSPLQWTRYVYAGSSDQIVADSVFWGALFINGQMVFHHASNWVDRYTYDSYGRIVKALQVYNDGSTFPHAYSYDQNGNLTAPAGTYDNKTNFRRTNKIWMFLDRDYSVNNPFVANSYNHWGLPTDFTLTPDHAQPFISFIGHGITVGFIHYYPK